MLPPLFELEWQPHTKQANKPNVAIFKVLMRFEIYLFTSMTPDRVDYQAVRLTSGLSTTQRLCA